jgi:signal peptidase I
MQPLINTNDIIVATKWIRVASLRTGDFVVVNIPIPGGYVLTVRQIEQQTNAPAGQFYLRAANTNGYDSRQFGTLGASNIVGRIIWILK